MRSLIARVLRRRNGRRVCAPHETGTTTLRQKMWLVRVRLRKHAFVGARETMRTQCPQCGTFLRRKKTLSHSKRRNGLHFCNALQRGRLWF